MSSTTENARRRDIKAGNSVADLRRRRSSMAVTLRKAKKEQGQAKRRNTARPASSSTPASADGGAATPGAPARPPPQPVTAADVPELAKALGGAPEGRVEAARGLRKVLSLESDPPVTEVIAAGAMPLLVLCLDEHSNTDLQVMSVSCKYARASGISRLCCLQHIHPAVGHIFYFCGKSSHVCPAPTVIGIRLGRCHAIKEYKRG